MGYLIFTRIRFLRYGRNDLTYIKVKITKDMKLWESNQSLVHYIQYVVTSTNAERSNRVKKG